MIERAKAFGRKSHGSQVRKYSGLPYFTHPEAVAAIVADLGWDEATICAALLHDVVEDTPVTIEEIRAEFGDEIARIVAGVTDVSKKTDGNRRTRKQIDLQHLAQGDAKIHTVKLADCIHNARGIIKDDPDFAVVYMREKRDLLKVLTKGDPRLQAEAAEIVREFFGGTK